MTANKLAKMGSLELADQAAKIRSIRVHDGERFESFPLDDTNEHTPAMRIACELILAVDSWRFPSEAAAFTFCRDVAFCGLVDNIDKLEQLADYYGEMAKR